MLQVLRNVSEKYGEYQSLEKKGEKKIKAVLICKLVHE